MYSDFLSLVRTDSEKRVLINEIDILINSLYSLGANSLKNTLEKNIRSETSSLFQKAYEKERNYLGFLKALRQLTLELKEINITIAVDPSNEIIDTVHSWLESNIGKSLIINFEKNESLIGGAQISYMGKYFELTLKKELENELASNAITRAKINPQ